MKNIILLLTLFFIYGCGAKESIVKTNGVLTPVEMKSKKGRGTGLRVVYSISSNLEIKLVTHGFRIGWDLFSKGGNYYNKDVSVSYFISGDPIPSYESITKTYIVGKIEYKGKVVYQDPYL